jgi:hypothetical protein
MTSNLNDFISNFKGGARPNRFRVQITWPGLVGTPNVRDEIVVTAAQMPASVMGIIQVPYKGRQIPLPGDRTFEDWTITVVNDITFSHRNAFERWSNLINAHEANVAGTDNYRNLLGTMDVVHLDRNDKVIKTIKLFNAWPSNISAIDLGYDQNDVLEQYQVTLSYSHWGSGNSPTS